MNVEKVLQMYSDATDMLLSARLPDGAKEWQAKYLLCLARLCSYTRV